ncbi:MAG: hypothetical protein ACRC9R_05935 [Enterovibrio sp.]
MQVNSIEVQAVLALSVSAQGIDERDAWLRAEPFIKHDDFYDET